MKTYEYTNKLERYNARHERARQRGKRWAEAKPHEPKEPSR